MREERKAKVAPGFDLDFNGAIRRRSWLQQRRGRGEKIGGGGDDLREEEGVWVFIQP